MKTEFYRLAEKISRSKSHEYIYLIDNLQPKYHNFFFKIYKVASYAELMLFWGINAKYNWKQVQILALLFADLMWIDEVKTKRKWKKQRNGIIYPNCLK